MLRTVKTTLMIFNSLPVDMRLLGTICYYVDARAGTIDRKWILPLDIPRPGGIITNETAVPVLESAQGMPILN